LIENALRAENVPFRLIYKKSHLKFINEKNKIVNVVKIHGSIHDKHNMAITIKNIAQKNVMDFRKSLFDRIIKNNNYSNLVILGYSCSDVFDLNPFFENSRKKNKTIFFIEHFSKRNIHLVKDISEKKEPNPFANYNGYLIKTDTDKFIRKLWNTSVNDKYSFLNPPIINWQSFIDEWIQKTISVHSDAVLSYLKGCFFQKIDKYKLSNKYLRVSLRNSTIKTHPWLYKNILRLIGINYRSLGKYQKSLSYLENSLDECKNDKDDIGICEAKISIGIVYEDMKDHNLAINSYLEAYNLSKDYKTKGRCLGNIGIVYKNKCGSVNIKKAITYHRKALRYAIRAGDKQGEGRTLGNIGIAYSDLGKKSLAIKYYQRAYKIAYLLADIRHQGIWLANTGMDQKKHDKEKAVINLQKAIELFKTIKAKHFVQECENDLNLIKQNNA
jgi:tetratricopeptide (TPR) repeat protein